MASLIAAKLPAQICAVISNDPAAKGLVTAADHGITTAVVDHRQFKQRSDFDAALAQAIDAHSPDIVVLAGFMRVLTEDFVNLYRGRLINIHPSLLPSFTGLHTHRQALDAGVPVIASDLDVFREIGQGVPDLLPPDNVDGWAAAVMAYAAPESPARAAQMARLAQFRAPDWPGHFAQVEAFLETL